jgi:hypothetical protein
METKILVDYDQEGNKIIIDKGKRCVHCNAYMIYNHELSKNLQLHRGKYLCKNIRECKQNTESENTRVQFEIKNDQISGITYKGECVIEVKTD